MAPRPVLDEAYLIHRPEVNAVGDERPEFLLWAALRASSPGNHEAGLRFGGSRVRGRAPGTAGPPWPRPAPAPGTPRAPSRPRGGRRGRSPPVSSGGRSLRPAGRPGRSPRPGRGVSCSAARPRFSKRWTQPCTLPGGVPEEAGAFPAGEPLGDEEDSVEALVVPRVLRTADLVLQGQGHHGGVGYGQGLHAPISMRNS